MTKGQEVAKQTFKVWQIFSRPFYVNWYNIDFKQIVFRGKGRKLLFSMTQ